MPHSGFGLGFERLVVYVTGMGNVRDVIPFPRTPAPPSSGDPDNTRSHKADPGSAFCARSSPLISRRIHAPSPFPVIYQILRPGKAV